jgi:flagellar biosynthesis/type III secretory pathway chaperone
LFITLILIRFVKTKKIMLTQLDDLNKELKDIETTLRTEVPKDVKERLLKRQEIIRSIIYNIY